MTIEIPRQPEPPDPVVIPYVALDPAHGPEVVVTIIHHFNDEPQWFAGGREWEPADRYQIMYSYGTKLPLDMHAIWGENNAVEGDEINVALGYRSLMVGDIIVVEGHGFYAVMPVGFHRLTEREVAAVAARMVVPEEASVEGFLIERLRDPT